MCVALKAERSLTNIAVCVAVQVSIQGKLCDVFISHRGPDTKPSFVNLLADQLENHGITVFYDKKDLDPAADLPAWEIMKAALRSAKIQVSYTGWILVPGR